ncbi:eCIS core domain-containing protein [Thiococcus pfennigii]|uniref:eCIS core domain-containing protein n=1 Tax=Thiococcus pfennigii TaxID=1057 RepID=UPI001902F5C5|nr:DUF4157 domain-containing protein [Thiococcus pfennigii]MBK1699391.1 hypothetical protein [Thiococcus pfennigii]
MSKIGANKACKVSDGMQGKSALHRPQQRIAKFTAIEAIASLQNKAGNEVTNGFLQQRLSPLIQSTLTSSGQPLAPGVRAQMESRFGHNFSQVRIHTDAIAAQSAELLGAKAYTFGSDVVFGKGRYAPDTSEGKRLITHELAHVIQQSRGGSESNHLSPSSKLERSASQTAEYIAAGHEQVDVEGNSSPGIAREINSCMAADAIQDEVEEINLRLAEITDWLDQPYTKGENELGERYNEMMQLNLRLEELHRTYDYLPEEEQRQDSLRQIASSAIAGAGGAPPGYYDMPEPGKTTGARGQSGNNSSNPVQLSAQERNTAAIQNLAEAFGLAQKNQYEQEYRGLVGVRPPYPVQQRAAVGEVAIPIVKAVDFFIGFVPIAGDILAVIEAAAGYDLSGDKLPDEARIMLALSAIPLAGDILGASGHIAKIASRTGRKVEEILVILRKLAGFTDRIPHLKNLLDAARKVGRSARRRVAETTSAAMIGAIDALPPPSFGPSIADQPSAVFREIPTTSTSTGSMSSATHNQRPQGNRSVPETTGQRADLQSNQDFIMENPRLPDPSALPVRKRAIKQPQRKPHGFAPNRHNPGRLIKPGQAFEEGWASPGARDPSGVYPTRRVGKRRIPITRIEQLSGIPVSRWSKAWAARMRQEARDYYHSVYPGRSVLDVHHRIPLEWAFLFPSSNPNRLQNLIGLSQDVHNAISAKWTEFAANYRQLRRSPTAAEVQAMAVEIDKEFGRYYNRRSRLAE